MQESSLHAALKALFTQEGDQQEVPVDGYLIDVVRGDLLIEIQTRNFTALKPKLANLLPQHRVHLVHPIAQEKWIVQLPAKGRQPIGRRRSPKRGRREDLFYELVRIPHLVSHPNLTLEILLIKEEEFRRNDGQGSWRRRGWSITDRGLIEVVQRVVLATPDDFLAFLPPGVNEPFTVGEVAAASGLARSLVSKMVYSLKVMGLLSLAGKRGRAYQYVVIPRP